MAHPIVYGPAMSSYVWSARLALAEKGVTHELVDVPFGAAEVITSLLGAFVGVILSRIAAEFVLIVFRINEHLGAIRNRGQM